MDRSLLPSLRRPRARHTGRVALALCLVLAAGPEAAHALGISGITIAPTASNTADALANTGASRSQVASSQSIVGSTPGPVADTVGATVGFDSRYAALLAADREAGGGSVSAAATSAYTIVFTVDNPTGADYRLDIDTSRLGAVTFVSDGGGDATATLGAVTGTIDGVTNASLALAALGPQTTAGSANTPFNQASTTVSIVLSAVSQTFTLGFEWTSDVLSSQDEVAIRMGLPGGLTSSTADNYPGVGGRDPALDGHFVRVGVVLVAMPVPEPGTGVLVGLGLVAIAVSHGRRRRDTPA